MGGHGALKMVVATQLYDEYGKNMTLAVDNTDTNKSLLQAPLCVETLGTNWFSAGTMWAGMAGFTGMKKGLNCKAQGMTKVYEGEKAGFKYTAYLDVWKTIKSVM